MLKKSFIAALTMTLLNTSFVYANVDAEIAAQEQGFLGQAKTWVYDHRYELALGLAGTALIATAGYFGYQYYQTNAELTDLKIQLSEAQRASQKSQVDLGTCQSDLKVANDRVSVLERDFSVDSINQIKRALTAVIAPDKVDEFVALLSQENDIQPLVQKAIFEKTGYLVDVVKDLDLQKYNFKRCFDEQASDDVKSHCADLTKSLNEMVLAKMNESNRLADLKMSSVEDVQKQAQANIATAVAGGAFVLDHKALEKLYVDAKIKPDQQDAFKEALSKALTGGFDNKVLGQLCSTSYTTSFADCRGALAKLPKGSPADVASKWIWDQLQKSLSNPAVTTVSQRFPKQLFDEALTKGISFDESSIVYKLNGDAFKAWIASSQKAAGQTKSWFNVLYQNAQYGQHKYNLAEPNVGTLKNFYVNPNLDSDSN